MKSLTFKRKYSLAADHINKLLNGLSKRCFRKSDCVYLYKVARLKDGSLYPVYTSKPYMDYCNIDNRKGFPAKCNWRYAEWIINLRKTLKSDTLV